MTTLRDNYKTQNPKHHEESHEKYVKTAVIERLPIIRSH